MTALNFPDSPSNGDTYQGYTYNSTKGTWTKDATTSATEPPVNIMSRLLTGFEQ